MKDIIDEIDSRIKSPFFGYFIFSLIAFNWEEIFYLIVDISSASKRIEHFHNGTDVYTLLAYPFLVALIYAVAYPWLHYLVMLFSTKPTELKNTLQAESEHLLLIKKNELEKLRSQTLSIKEEELIERAKRDNELSQIENENIRNNLEEEIEKLRKNRDSLSNSKKQSNSKVNTKYLKEQLELHQNTANKAKNLGNIALLEKTHKKMQELEAIISSEENDA